MEDQGNNTDIGISTKAVSSNYKVNQAGVPVLTKVLNKAPAYAQNGNNVQNGLGFKNGFNESILYSYVIKGKLTMKPGSYLLSSQEEALSCTM